jgi:hypothetical protein
MDGFRNLLTSSSDENSMDFDSCYQRVIDTVHWNIRVQWNTGESIWNVLPVADLWGGGGGVKGVRG